MGMPKSWDWEKIKQQRVTVPVVALLFGVLFLWQGVEWFTGWHFANFVSKAEASEITTAINNNTNAINDHITTYEINEAEKAITGLQDKLFELAQWVEVNGATEISNQRQNELTRRLESWRRYLSCLVGEGLNCDDIRP